MLFRLCIMRLYTGLLRKNYIDTLAGRTVVWLLAYKCGDGKNIGSANATQDR